MTERLYYAEPSRRQFDATVVDVVERKGRTHVRLDRSAFYPTSGGQPFDIGTLAGARVVEVLDETADRSGDVIHVVEGAGLTAGQQVAGEIDWPRRFDHMQQHTGQHILSAAFAMLFNVATVSFHMGADVSTIDLGRDVAVKEVDTAVREANRIVWENRPVTIRFVTGEEAAALPLRKPPKKTGTLRLIEVADCDLSACGGTHVARTGEIGMVAVSGWERFKSGTRVEFVCGGRALRRFQTLRDTTAAAARALSIAAEEVPAAVERLQQEAKEQRRTVAALESKLAIFKGNELAAEADTMAQGRAVVRAIDGDAGALKALASAIAAHNGVAAVLVSTSTPSLVVVARAADLTIRANDILAGLVAKFGGRGGGKADLAQGGGLSGPVEDILLEGRRLLAGG